MRTRMTAGKCGVGCMALATAACVGSVAAVLMATSAAAAARLATRR